MSKIGILAYGSLIDDPGVELKPLISEKIKDIETPFNIEFARSSRSRNGAPTVVPVEGYGGAVQAVILVLNDDVEIEIVKDLLWRRETRNENSNKHYQNPINPSDNQVVVGEISELSGIDIILYTKIGANIDTPTPEKLANLAIESAKGRSGEEGKDGISYLIALKKQSIKTPLMPQYEEEILKSVGASSLSEALNLVRKKV
jgi:cation transport regulator ChaC